MENISNLNGRIYFVRHGQSTYNAAENDKHLCSIRDKDLSFIDTPLSQFGIQ